jgi:ketosteroid isomerase-like protein
VSASPDEATRATLETIQRFNEAFNRHDVDAVMALMTPDCVFENTFPAPDGERFEGAPAVRRVPGARREGFEKLAYVKG